MTKSKIAKKIIKRTKTNVLKKIDKELGKLKKLTKLKKVDIKKNLQII